jgi:hypothetical protein
MTAQQLRRHLDDLAAERLVAEASGLAGNDAYMADLEGEIDAVHSAYVGAAVTEIAVLRGRLGARQHG